MVVQGAAGELGVARRVGQEAEHQLRQWMGLVEAAPSLAHSGERATRIFSLACWYRRVVSDRGCLEQPPLEGVDALADELTSTPSYERLIRLDAARWAVRIAEEMVRWRSVCQSAEPAAIRMVSARFESMLSATRHHLAPAGVAHPA